MGCVFLMVLCTSWLHASWQKVIQASDSNYEYPIDVPHWTVVCAEFIATCSPEHQLYQAMYDFLQSHVNRCDGVFDLSTRAVAEVVAELTLEEQHDHDWLHKEGSSCRYGFCVLKKTGLFIPSGTLSRIVFALCDLKNFFDRHVHKNGCGADGMLINYARYALVKDDQRHEHAKARFLNDAHVRINTQCLESEQMVTEDTLLKNYGFAHDPRFFQLYTQAFKDGHYHLESLSLQAARKLVQHRESFATKLDELALFQHPLIGMYKQVYGIEQLLRYQSPQHNE